VTGRGNGIICMSAWVPSVERRRLGENGFEVRLGHELADEYLRFVGPRCRPNTVLAGRKHNDRGRSTVLPVQL
jgi:hypothetical protein